MKPHIIVITGYLAAGKSTFARQLSNVLHVPCIIKDTFKSELSASIEITNREESSRFSAVTFDAMMYVVERLIETGGSIIIEGNFVPYGIKKTDEAGVIKALADKYDCRLLTYKFVGNTRILYERFIKRDILPERGQANMMFYKPSYNEFDIWCHDLDEFSIGGKTIEIDTSYFNSIDFGQYIEMARNFLKS